MVEDPCQRRDIYQVARDGAQCAAACDKKELEVNSKHIKVGINSGLIRRLMTVCYPILADISKCWLSFFRQIFTRHINYDERGLRRSRQLSSQFAARGTVIFGRTAVFAFLFSLQYLYNSEVCEAGMVKATSRSFIES